MTKQEIISILKEKTDLLTESQFVNGQILSRKAYKTRKVCVFSLSAMVKTNCGEVYERMYTSYCISLSRNNEVSPLDNSYQWHRKSARVKRLMKNYVENLSYPDKPELITL